MSTNNRDALRAMDTLIERVTKAAGDYHCWDGDLGWETVETLQEYRRALAAPTPPASQGDAAPAGDALTPEALAALRAYQQGDRDGVMVLVSRQALDEAIAYLAAAPAPAVRGAVEQTECPNCGAAWNEDCRVGCGGTTPAAEAKGGALDANLRATIKEASIAMEALRHLANGVLPSGERITDVAARFAYVQRERARAAYSAEIARTKDTP